MKIEGIITIEEVERKHINNLVLKKADYPNSTSHQQHKQYCKQLDNN